MGQKFGKENVDIEEDLANTVPDVDHTTTLSDETLVRTLPKVDRISTLPDDILSAIISFLNLRDAVKTSILSRRWRYLCASLSDVNFDVQTLFSLDGDHQDTNNKTALLERNCARNKNTLANVVNQFFELYRGPKLHSLRVSFCYSRLFLSNFDSWISKAVKVGIEKLDLNFVCRDFIDCECIYDYKNMTCYLWCWRHLFEAFNLKHLRLHSCMLVPDSSREIKGLTTLDLNYVPLQYREIHHIFCSCLNLEWLKLRGCKLRDKLCVTGLARLKYLAVDNCPGLKEIELNAINLTTFEFYDRANKELTFSCVPKLEKVFFCLHFSGALPFIIREVATQLPHLKSLWIATSSLWVKEVVAFPHVLNINQLEFFIGFDDGFDLIKTIASIIRACPLLQKLNVGMPYASDSRRRVLTGEDPPVPSHLHTQLEEVHIGRFSGSWDQIEFAIYLLKSAVMLKQIVIDSGYKVYIGGGEFVSGNSNRWSAEVRELICDQLQGMNLSGNTEVIIR